MNHRERVFKAFEYETPNRTPLDEPEGRFRIDTYKKLEKYFNTFYREAILNFLGIDFRHVERGISNSFKKKAKYIDIPFDNYVKIISENLFEDEWGIRYEFTSSKLHWRYAYHPLSNEDLLDSYEFPDLDAPGRFDEAIKIIKEKKNKYVIGAHLWGSLFEIAWSLRGFQKLMMDLYKNEIFINKLLDKLLKYRVEEAKRFIDLGIDIVQLGDDIGMQTGMVISPAIWRKYFKERMKILINEIKKHSRNKVYIFYHSDGNIEPIINELIEIGVQILNPIQPECMDPTRIKEKYGDKIILHGTISIQRTLPFGTINDVKEEVNKRIKECGFNGGLVLAPSHSPQPEVPIENLVAMYKEAKKINLKNLA